MKAVLTPDGGTGLCRFFLNSLKPKVNRNLRFFRSQMS